MANATTNQKSDKIDTMAETGRRLRELRDDQGLSREELATQSGISVTVIKKIEGGGTARMETLHKLARTLGVVTMTFVPAGYPGPSLGGRDENVFADMRAAIAPPISLKGTFLHETADHDELSLARLTKSVDALGAAYHSSQFDQLAAFAPPLVRSAYYHVDNLEGEKRDQALRARSDVLNIVGRYLIQVREHDLALIAISNALRDALAIGDMSLAGSAVSVQAWAMMRQGRFGEVERLCAESADMIEPRMSTATTAELDSWGWLLLRASAAAARNNRPDRASEYANLAIIAGNRVGKETGRPAGRQFGPVSAALILPENSMIEGNPRKAIEQFRQIPRDGGRTNPSTWDRARLDAARAHVTVGDTGRAVEILMDLRHTVPEWMRHQQFGQDTVRELMNASPRLTRDHRALAKFYSI